MTKKMPTNRAIAVFLAIFIVATTAVPYSKYNRSCKDIGCRPTEVCVMAEDRCDSYQQESCGRYPTCQKANSGGETCTTKICPPQHFCKTENGAAVCVSTAQGSAYDSAGIASINGQKVSTNDRPSVPADTSNGSSYSDRNPYGASAPPTEWTNHHGTDNRPAYPAYPTNNNNNNHGYPPYPTNNNNGYPPYPTNNNNNNNRGGVAVDQYGYPLYPSTQPRPDTRYQNNYPPQHNMPQHNTGWGSNHPNTVHWKNGADVSVVSALVLVLSVLSFGIFAA